jgi:hypothetical protein
VFVTQVLGERIVHRRYAATPDDRFGQVQATKRLARAAESFFAQRGQGQAATDVIRQARDQYFQTTKTDGADLCQHGEQTDMLWINAEANDVDLTTIVTGSDFDAWDQPGFVFERLPAEQRIMVGDGETLDLLTMHGGQQLTGCELAITVVSVEMKVDAHSVGL